MKIYLKKKCPYFLSQIQYSIYCKSGRVHRLFIVIQGTETQDPGPIPLYKKGCSISSWLLVLRMVGKRLCIWLCDGKRINFVCDKIKNIVRDNRKGIQRNTRDDDCTEKDILWAIVILRNSRAREMISSHLFHCVECISAQKGSSIKLVI